MMLELSEEAGNAILNTVADMLDGGSIEFFSQDGRSLAVLKLSNPAAIPAAGSEMEFRDIAQGRGLASGIATSAKIVGGSGVQVFSCDVGDDNSDAVIKLNPPKISRDVPIELNSFRLSMPIG